MCLSCSVWNLVSSDQGIPTWPLGSGPSHDHSDESLQFFKAEKPKAVRVST